MFLLDRGGKHRSQWKVLAVQGEDCVLQPSLDFLHGLINRKRLCCLCFRCIMQWKFAEVRSLVMLMRHGRVIHYHYNQKRILCHDPGLVFWPTDLSYLGWKSAQVILDMTNEWLIILQNAKKKLNLIPFSSFLHLFIRHKLYKSYCITWACSDSLTSQIQCLQLRRKHVSVKYLNVFCGFLVIFFFSPSA